MHNGVDLMRSQSAKDGLVVQNIPFYDDEFGVISDRIEIPKGGTIIHLVEYDDAMVGIWRLEQAGHHEGGDETGTSGNEDTFRGIFTGLTAHREM